MDLENARELAHRAILTHHALAQSVFKLPHFRTLSRGIENGLEYVHFLYYL